MIYGWSRQTYVSHEYSPSSPNGLDDTVLGTVHYRAIHIVSVLGSAALMPIGEYHTYTHTCRTPI